MVIIIINVFYITQNKISEDNSSLPEVFRQPLLKVEKDKGQYEGIQSGRRSALIKVEGKWYRLKGCGDLTAGFPLLKVLILMIELHGVSIRTYTLNFILFYFQVPDTEWKDPVQIRGAMFSHTSSRELFYSGVIDTALKDINVSCTNSPKGN